MVYYIFVALLIGLSGCFDCLSHHCCLECVNNYIYDNFTHKARIDNYSFICPP